MAGGRSWAAPPAGGKHGSGSLSTPDPTASPGAARAVASRMPCCGPGPLRRGAGRCRVEAEPRGRFALGLEATEPPRLGFPLVGLGGNGPLRSQPGGPGGQQPEPGASSRCPAQPPGRRLPGGSWGSRPVPAGCWGVRPGAIPSAPCGRSSRGLPSACRAPGALQVCRLPFADAKMKGPRGGNVVSSAATGTVPPRRPLSTAEGRSGPCHSPGPV